MASETSVANMGLRFIGQTAIVSRTDGSDNANIVNDIFDDVRDDLLRSHPWNFATKRIKLAQSSTLPVFEFDFAYPLPADWISTMSVHSNDAGHSTVLHRMELIGTQRAIVSSADQIYLRYVAQITDPNLWAADFRRCVSLAIGRDLAVAIASSNTLQDQLNKQLSKTMARARSADAIGASPELRQRGSWANARNGFRNDSFLSD